jgi:hypothetical protein
MVYRHVGMVEPIYVMLAHIGQDIQELLQVVEAVIIKSIQYK